MRRVAGIMHCKFVGLLVRLSLGKPIKIVNYSRKNITNNQSIY